MRSATQLDRVMKAAARYNGVCQADFAHPTCDGLPPITRVAARLQEAEDRLGASFEILGWRSKTKVFRLVGEPAGVDGEPEPRVCQEHVPAAPANPGLFPSSETAHWKDAA